jgi:hypothetical protein
MLQEIWVFNTPRKKRDIYDGILTLRAPRPLIKALKEKAREKNVTVADLLRVALAEILERENILERETEKEKI